MWRLWIHFWNMLVMKGVVVVIVSKCPWSVRNSICMGFGFLRHMDNKNNEPAKYHASVPYRMTKMPPSEMLENSEYKPVGSQ